MRRLVSASFGFCNDKKKKITINPIAIKKQRFHPKLAQQPLYNDRKRKWRRTEEKNTILRKIKFKKLLARKQ